LTHTVLYILNRSGVTPECVRHTDRRTDGPTDFLIARAALHYVARPKHH